MRKLIAVAVLLTVAAPLPAIAYTQAIFRPARRTRYGFANKHSQVRAA
jgi:hypothetical protein